jgi:sodium/pantothenate symporter
MDMGEHTWSWIFFVAYAAAIAGIALWSRARTKNMESFSVGTRTVSPFFIGLSLAANLTSAATFVINPGLIYLYGVSGFIGYGIATPLALFIALAVFSTRFRTIGDRFTVLTVPQWIGDRYGDRRMTIYFSLLSLLQITFLVLIVVGLSVVLASALGIPIIAALLVVIGFTFTYILIGGAGAHILTNSIQAFIMIAVALMFLGSGLRFFDGGIAAFVDRLAAVGPHFAAATNPDSLLYRDLFEVIVANAVIGIAIIMQPHVISKALYLRSARDVRVYLTTAFVVSSLFFLVLATGLFARLAMPGELLRPDTVIATYMVQTFSPFLRAVVVLGILSAGFSTMEGILVALSSIFSNDFLRHVLPRHITATDAWKPRSLMIARVFLVALAPVTFFLSYDQILHPSLSVAMLAQNGVYGLFSATFVPVLFGIFAARPSKTWAMIAAVAAVVVHFGMYYFEITMYHNNPAVPAACAIITSSVIMGAATLFTRGGAEVRTDGEERA